ncbi:hypothetical protein CC80DRAFT_488048 [Byssothecium circinans]|uniref:Sister chromatid cohesion and DNA repair protein n=1 Tax=Byssothecium circinans TaxID=147558 RepID=A0A6A5UKI3_9PLEO|nr:hypothetical protein CC80DRAFT_488048 [Byssothecium circinans]
MATRSRRSAATAAAAVEAEEEEEQEQEQEQEMQEGLQRLRFNKPLLSRPGKQIGVTELLARLKTLCEELREIPQEDADTESLTATAKELAHPSLIQHKDPGVRAWTACSLVEMFRLFAPNAPYSASQLKEIFTLIIVKILPLLADPSHSYNSQHMYVLKSLAEFKSIVIVTDIPGSQQLTSALFTACFDVLSGPSRAKSGEELSKNVEHHMTQTLSILIDESPTISSDIVDVIVAQFLWADPVTLGSAKGKKNAPVDSKQSTLRRKEAPPAYNMAKNICNAFPDKMARLFGTYFGSVIVDFASGPKIRTRGGSADDSDDEEAKGPSEDDINDASKAHRLLRELWRCAPGALQEIIPHLQEELGTENVQLRQLATETFGDMISGIGAAGPPPPPDLDPAAYPSQSLTPSASTRAYSYLTTPASLNSFPSHYPAAYHAFLSRQIDRSPIIRASLATGIARIIMTSAGGVGLDPEEEKNLLKLFAKSLIDSDDRVRLAAVKAIEYYDFNDIVQKLGENGSMSEPGSILYNLADRIKDKKPAIHTAAIKLLGKVWGVAAGAIADGDEYVIKLLGPIPSRILEACYVKDAGITAQVDTVFYEALLPLNYPPMKPKAAVNGNSQIVRDSQASSEQTWTEADLDKIRAERQLVLVHGLEEKAKKVLFANQGNQVAHANYMEAFLKLCEQYNGGVMDSGEQETKKKLDGLIAYYGKTLPDSSRANEDIWKFVKAHDRRNYQLIQFCMAPDSDYRKIFKSIKEFRKRIDENPPSATFMETFTPLLYRVSLLCFNKSHVPAIIAHTRTDDKALGATAHEVLKEISTKHPKVFSTHVKDLCKTLESEAPTEKTPNPPGAVDDLKACASFAKKFPKEVPLNSKDSRKLVQGLLNFALYGAPPKAAKHAVTIIMSCDNKKEMHAREILKKSMKNFAYGCDYWLTKLAALSQLVLLAQQECEDDNDALLAIAVENVLLKEHPASEEAEEEWMDTPDDDIVARTWALKILVNRLLANPNEETLAAQGAPTFKLLNRIVKEGGEMSKKHHTPLAHKNRQRLLAANFLLKLACQQRLDRQITPTDFSELALVTHDKSLHVRKGFALKLMKYLGQNKLSTRYYTILFMFAHEPDAGLKELLMTWLRSRRAAFAARKDTVLETSVFARLLSLIAHHPDFSSDEETLKQMSSFILYYLKCVATEDNLALIYHMAGRVKTVRDGIDASGQTDENLYILSDLAQALILAWEDQNGWSMQSFPGKQKLPAGIFKPLESHDRGQEIAEKQYIDKDFAEELEPLVRKAIKSKKRKAGDNGEKPRKKIKSERTPGTKKDRPTKTPRKKRRGGDNYDENDVDGVVRSSGPRRKSDRKSGVNKSYVEISSDEDGVDAGAEEEGEGEDEEMSDAEWPGKSPAQEDVEMDDADKSPEPQSAEDSGLSEPEPDPEPEPPKKTPKGRAAKKANGVNSSSPAVQKGKGKAAEPAEPKVTPAKSTRATRGAATAEEPTSPKQNKPARIAAKGRAKKEVEAAVSSSLAANGMDKGTGTVRRSGRTRS